MDQKDSGGVSGKEQEYNNLFEEFINSTDDKTFTKADVKKIIEAHLFQEFIGRYQSAEPKIKTRKIVVDAKSISAKLLSPRFVRGFLFSCLFNTGFLILITTLIYKNIFVYKPSVFIIGLFLTLIEKFVQPFIFIGDFISFSFHKIGLLSILIYGAVFYTGANLLGNSVSFGQAVIAALIILFLSALINLITKESLYKAKIEDDGGDFDE